MLHSPQLHGNLNGNDIIIYEFNVFSRFLVPCHKLPRLNSSAVSPSVNK